MGLFFVYILKSSVCLAIFYLFYRLLLARETFHRFNRFSLLGILLLSCLLPLVEVSVKQETEVHQTMLTLEQLLMMADAVNATEAGARTETATVTWIQVALLVYLAGIVFFAFRNVYSLVRLLMLLKSGKKEDIGSYLPGRKERVTLIVHNCDIAPFSWMGYIVISRKDLEENGREILIHELAHIHNRHSWDLLVADVCIFFQWFNPASWLLKQELQNIHEFEADETVIKEGVDAKQYQLLLIKKAVGTRLYSMANSFNHSKLKKRITMMLKEKSSPWARLKYLYVLPVAAIAVTAFARPEVSDKVEKISSVKVNDLAAIVETKVAESAGDTTKPADVKYVPAEVRKRLKGTLVFEVAEEMPEFPGGGMSAFMDYIKTNMRYPASAKENGTQGRVTVQFVVDEDGSIKDSKVLRSVDKDMDAEALRLINTMPKWKPGRQKGQPVAVKFTVPVMFRLDDDKLEKTSSANGITVEGYAGNGKEPLYIVDGKEVTPSVMRWVLSIPFFISCIRQQNPLTVLSKIILRKVKQFNLPPPKKMRDFCIFEDTPRLFLLGNRQFTFIAHNLDVAEDVVGQICHRHIRLRPYNPYCPDNKAVHTLLFKTEYVLDKATGLGLAPVLSLLFFCQRMIPTAFLADYRIHAMLLHG